MDCVQAPLTPGTAWWEDLAGNQNVYWTGEGPEHTCQCGVENSCVLSDVKCNCDADVAVLLVDTGNNKILNILRRIIFVINNFDE